jgi:hypothetical protein
LIHGYFLICTNVAVAVTSLNVEDFSLGDRKLMDNAVSLDIVPGDS